MEIFMKFLFVVTFFIGLPTFMFGTLKAINYSSRKLGLTFMVLGMIAMSIGVYILLNIPKF